MNIRAYLSSRLYLATLSVGTVAACADGGPKLAADQGSVSADAGDDDELVDASAPSLDARVVLPDSSVPVDSGYVSPADRYQEVFDQGLLRYAGQPQVKETSVTKSGSIDVHHFSSKDRGPICMYGDEFFVESREGSSDTLMIFLQGGGVCLTEVCAATPVPILSLQLFDLSSLIGIGGLLDARNVNNPTRDFDVVNAPYCDGSLFSGDVDRVLSDGNPNNGDQDMAFQRGLQNLTATLEVAKKLHPNPPRIVLAGSSGGAYGVILGTVLTRYYYPDTELLVVSDSGAPIVNGIDTNFVVSAVKQLNIEHLIPKSCTDCIANGHLTGLLEWALRGDPALSIAYMTHARDHVIGEFFMGTTADQFQAAVIGETDRLLSSFPGRVWRFIIPSAKHTLAMNVDGVIDLQGPVLGIAGGLGVGFVGPSVNSPELATWRLGGMNEVGTDANGKAWPAYKWLQGVFNAPYSTPSVLQLE